MFAESRYLSLRGVPGTIRTELVRIEESGISLGRVVSTGHEIELKDGGNFTFLMPSAGRLDILVGGNEYRAIPGGPMVFRSTERRTRASPMFAQWFKATTLQVSNARLEALALAEGLSVGAAFPGDAEGLAGDIGTYLASQLPQLVDSILLRPSEELPQRVSELIAGLIDDQLCEIMGVAVESRWSRKVLPAFHRVRKAEEIMHAHSDEPLSVLQIAHLLGVTLRSLQLAFAEIHDGLSPRDVLNRIRLEKARARLLAADGDVNVTSVAMDSGIFHLGRFSQAYARTFGEKPSETLLRRRAS
ncbi:MAG: helix-turn-helix transcriptional regulator [Tabrizicola sp.]